MKPAVTIAPAVARKLAVQAAIESMGRKWLLHPLNHVQRLPQPYGQPKRRKYVQG